MKRSSRDLRRFVLRVVLGMLAMVLLARVVASLNLDAGLALAARTGPRLALAALPLLAGLAIDGVAWTSLAESVGARTRWARMFAARIAVEAVVLTAPGGSVAGAGASPGILARVCDVSAADGVAIVAARKWLVMRAHAIYLVLAALCAWGPLSELSRALLGTRALPWMLLGSALLPLSASLSLQLGLGGGQLARRLASALERAPLASLRAWAHKSASYRRADEGLAALARMPRRRAGALTLVMLGAWLCEALDTLVTLRLLGVEVSPATVLGAEAAMSMLRSFAVFSPGGLGVVDVGYLGVARALGAADPDGVAVALLALRRGKELMLAALGYGLLAVYSRKGRSAEVLAGV